MSELQHLGLEDNGISPSGNPTTPSIFTAARWVDNVGSSFTGLAEGTAHLPGRATTFGDEKLCALHFEERAGQGGNRHLRGVFICKGSCPHRDLTRSGKGDGLIGVGRKSGFLCQVLWQAIPAAKPSMARANVSGGLDGNLCFSCCDSSKVEMHLQLAPDREDVERQRPVLRGDISGTKPQAQREQP